VPRISAEEKARNRERIMDAASRMFRTEGVENVGIAELMQAAGLTHGGFYNHFPSKEALAAEVCASAFADSRDLFAAKMERDRSVPPLDAVWREYLSPDHRDERTGGCPSASLLLDALRNGDEVQTAYAEGIEGLIQRFAGELVGDAEARGHELDADAAREQSIRLLSSMVGAMVLARAVKGPAPELSDEILYAHRCPGHG
jgi:TetR/AcrR family transcriptional repressor of nem operon